MSEHARLSRQQYGIWILQQAVPESGFANISFAFRTRTPLRWWPLNEAVAGLFARHRALRTRFRLVEGAPVRDVSAPDVAGVPLQVASVAEADLLDAMRAFAGGPFDLASDFPFRVCHFVLDSGGSVVCFVLHHIVGDASSGEMLMEELARMYDGVARHDEIPGDLARAFPEVAEPEAPASSLAYWREYLKGVESGAMVLPGSRPRAGRLSFAGDTCRMALSNQAFDALTTLSGRFRATPNMVMMAVFLAALVHEGLGPDLTIGIPVNARDPRKYGVGLGMNTIALRIRAEPTISSAELIRATREAFLVGLANSDISIEMVLDDLGRRSGDWRSPLYRQVFNWRSVQSSITIMDEAPESVEVPSQESQFDLQLAFVPAETTVRVNAIYSTDVHDRRQISALVQRLDALLVASAAAPDVALGDLDAGPAIGGEPTPVPRAPDGETVHSVGPSAGGGAPDEEIVGWLLDRTEEILDRRIDPEVDVFDQGFTSTRAMTLVSAVADRYAVDIGVRPIFEEGTLVALAEAITVALSSREAVQA